MGIHKYTNTQRHGLKDWHMFSSWPARLWNIPLTRPPCHKCTNCIGGSVAEKDLETPMMMKHTVQLYSVVCDDTGHRVLWIPPAASSYNWERIEFDWQSHASPPLYSFAFVPPPGWKAAAWLGLERSHCGKGTNNKTLPDTELDIARNPLCWSRTTSRARQQDNKKTRLQETRHWIRHWIP